MGSRYGGLKQVDPMGPSGETLLDYSVYDALRAGFDRVVFLIRRDIEAEFREKVGRRYEGRVNVDYAFQQLDTLPGGFQPPSERQKPWGTTHAIWCAQPQIDGSFIAINADDYYGSNSFEVLATFLREGSPEQARFAMAGYRLDRTLSDHGSVARGICEVDAEGRLTSIVEHTAIEHAGGRIFEKQADGTELVFTGAEPVSMNFWGLTPAVFPFLEKRLVDFLTAHGSELKAECYIPNTLGETVSAGEATLAVLPTNAPWFGVTYREDKPRVTAALAGLHENGTYPTPLWK